MDKPTPAPRPILDFICVTLEMPKLAERTNFSLRIVYRNGNYPKKNKKRPQTNQNVLRVSVKRLNMEYRSEEKKKKGALMSLPKQFPGLRGYCFKFQYF